MKRARIAITVVMLFMMVMAQPGYCCSLSFSPNGSGMGAPSPSNNGWMSKPHPGRGWGWAWGHEKGRHNKHHGPDSSSGPESTDTTATDPAATDPTTADPAATDTTATNPSSTDTTTTDPAATDTTTTNPSSTDTTATDTTATDPATTDPTDSTTIDTTASDTTTTEDAADTVATTGEDVAIDALDVDGLTLDWLKDLGVDKATHTAKVEKDANGKAKFVSIFDKDGTLLYRYDATSRLMEHFETSGEAEGKIKYVTSESDKKYTWRDTNAQDPGMGADGHVIVQKYSYDAEGNVASIEYYALTAGNRKKTTDQQKYSRYMYRKDTFEAGELADTEYFDDPRPTFWEPTVTGTVIKDEQGRLFLKSSEDGKLYLLTARKDGFDADGDGKVGAEEMSGVDWESYVGKEITVRGHQVQDENESDIYCNNVRAEMFGVVDVVEKDEALIDGWDEISDKITEAMNKVFVTVGDEKDVDKVYAKIYDTLLDELEKAGVSNEDIKAFADADMKALLPASDETPTTPPADDDTPTTPPATTSEDVAIDAINVEGLSNDWIKALNLDKTKHKAQLEKNADGTIAFLKITDNEGNLVYRFDPDSRLMEHYDDNGQIKYVTSDSTKKYTWRDTNAQDPGMGADGHVIVQKYNCDAEGNITSIEYYALTAGNRKKTEDQQKYSRYMYRKDTFEAGELADTAYFDDPRPTFWEPTVKGTVVKDEQNRYFLEAEDGALYLLTARKDGFDADGDGKVGAEEMSGVDWESYIGKEITVRGHQIQDENEADIYCNGEKAQMFGVVDVVETDEELIDGWDEISDKVTAAMNDLFVQVGDEKDVDKVYAKIYDKLLEALEEAGVSNEDIKACADADMKALLPAGTGDSGNTVPPGTDDGTTVPPGTGDVDTTIDFTPYTDSKSLIAKAWEYNNSKDYAKARAFALETIKRYESQALTQQASLSNYAASGKEADYWALNDVGTAYFIIGNSYRDENNKTKAIENYKKIVDTLGYAQCWDTQGWWWKVKVAAQEEIDKL